MTNPLKASTVTANFTPKKALGVHVPSKGHTGPYSHLNNRNAERAMSNNLMDVSDTNPENQRSRYFPMALVISLICMLYQLGFVVMNRFGGLVIEDHPIATVFVVLAAVATMFSGIFVATEL
jgi:hypothetical protein